jgi:hypothetical protein
MTTRVNSYSGLTVLEADGLTWHVCPTCNRAFYPTVEWCSHCELPPNALQSSEWQEIPPRQLWDEDYRDWSHDTGEDELDREEYPWRCG